MHQNIEVMCPVESAAPGRRAALDVRAELDRQRRARINQIEQFTLEAAQAARAGDEPRLAVARFIKLYAELALGEIDAALGRLERGSYGTCQRCAEAIPWEHLKTAPITTLCTACQSRTELVRFPNLRRARARAWSGGPIARS